MAKHHANPQFMLPSLSSTKRRVSLWVTLIYCYIGIGIMQFTVTATPPQDSSTFAQQIDNFIRSTMDCTGLPPAFSVAVVKDGEVVLSKGYGQTSVGDPYPVTSKTKFALGSLTKAFTAYLMANFVDKSENVTFDTPIKDFLPGFRLVDDYRSNHASLRDLLGHRMALPEDEPAAVLGIDPAVSRKQFAEKLQYLTTPYSFREKGIYNNYMYILAGDILERLYDGKSWESQIMRNIFQPLGMTQSGFVNELIQGDFRSDLALPVAYLNGSLIDISPVLFEIGRLAGAAGNIYSTADDMAKWMNFLLSKGNKTDYATPPGFDLDPKLVAMNFEPSIRLFDEGAKGKYKPHSPISEQQDDYCMGWMTSIYREYRRITHDGSIATHSTTLWLFPDSNVGIYTAVNGPEYKEGMLVRSLPYYVSDLLLGLQPFFNQSQLCTDGPLLSVNQEDEAEEEEEEEEDSNTTPFNCDTDTQCDLSDYVGKYTHIVFGDITIKTINDPNNGNAIPNIKQPFLFDFKFGRFGWLSLAPVSKNLFGGRVYGPYWYLNVEDSNSYPFVVRFYFEEGNLVHDGRKSPPGTSLYFGQHDEDLIGPFRKQTADKD